MSYREAVLSDADRLFFQRAMERFYGRYVPIDEAAFATLLDRLIAFDDSPERQHLRAQFWIAAHEHDLLALAALAEVTAPGHPGDGEIARRWFDANQGFLPEQRWDAMVDAIKPRNDSVPPIHDYARDENWICPMCATHHHRWASHARA